MFKRANKITALLVAAAAVVSLVPATGVNAADVKRIESKDGKVHGAVAYKDGKFLIDGELEGKDEAVYFLNNGKYTELEDLGAGSDYDKYGEKYATVDENNYYVDLTSGKVTDDTIADDNEDDAKEALRSKVKKDNVDRFDEADKDKELKSINNNKFGETWYETSYMTDDKTTSVSVYTDVKGNYIDADYNVGKIKIRTTGDSVTLENTDSLKKFGKGKASVGISDAKVLGQDKDYIYRTVTITINSTNSDILAVDGKEKLDGIGTKTVTYKAIQKISKAQASDKHKGIKYAKNVTTYAITDQKGKDLLSNTLIGVDSEYTFVNGKLIVRKVKGEEIDVAAVTLKNSYVEVKKADQESFKAVDVDADGNVWRLDKGYLYKYDNAEDWNKVYKVDGAMENLSIYDKNNFVVWDKVSDDDDRVYSVVGGKSSDKNDTEEVKVGWIQNADGTWSYNKEDGTKATGWVEVGANWYYLKANGIMATGWVQDGATWYYTNTSGAMQTGWVNVNGTWYYLNPVSDGTKGAMKTGWINDNGTWYYCDATGAMLANTTVGGYVLGVNGAWVR